MREDLSVFSKCFSWSKANIGLYFQAGSCFKKNMQTPLVSQVTEQDEDQCFPTTKTEQELNECFRLASKEAGAVLGEHNSK